MDYYYEISIDLKSPDSNITIMQKQNLPESVQQMDKDQKDNLLSQTSIQYSTKKVSGQSEGILSTGAVDVKTKQDDDIIDPIAEILQKNNIMPLLAVIDNIDLKRKIEDKPLISLLATKFIPLELIFSDQQVEFTLDDDRRSPLHYAIEANDVKAAAWLIARKHPNQQDNFGNTPILDAIRLGRRRCFLLCLQNNLYDQRAPIYAAMYNRHWELKIMHGLKIDVFSYRDEENKTAFERSLQYCSFDCAEFMVKIKPSLKLKDYRSFTESKGLMRKLTKIQKSMQIGQKLKDIVRPLLLIVFFYFAMDSNFLGFNQDELYERSRPFYFVLIFMILALYGLTYIFGTFGKQKVQYKQKNKLSQILKEPHYDTLEDICPICTNFTDYLYDHCYSCGCCVEKFHFHSFVCINKSNEVFWIGAEFLWIYLSWSLLHEFTSFLAWRSIDITSISSFSLIRFIALFENLFTEKNFIGTLWLVFLTFLFLYQVFYCLALVGMMAMRRTYQQVTHTQKYIHLYHIVKVQDNFMNKEKKIFERGFFGGFKRCIRNIFVYFFVRG